MSSELRALAVAAAQRGGRVCLKWFGTPTEVATKGADGDVVTEVDRAAEEAVRAVVLEARPDDSLCGEELQPHTGSSALQWVVDPLDGTTNFVRRLAYFATSVAVRDADGEWLAGAVCAPALGLTWSAAKGLGARLHSAGGSEALPLSLSPSSARVIGTGLSYDPARRREQIDRLATLMDGYTDLRRFGAAAIDLCLVAQQSLDAFVEDDLALHDWAAGALIAEEAGAHVTRPVGESGAVSARWQ